MEAFGQQPWPDQEQAVVDAFREDPRGVITAVRDVAAGVKQGRLRNGWAVLAKQLASRQQVTVTDDVADRRIACAEAWVLNAGVHLDRIDELDDELTRMVPWASVAQRESLLALWLEHRPRAEQQERELLDWYRGVGAAQRQAGARG